MLLLRLLGKYDEASAHSASYAHDDVASWANRYVAYAFDEGITNGVANVRANPVLIQSNGNVLSILGAPEGAEINVYNLSGQKVGSAKVASESTDVFTTLNAGEIGIVKIDEKAVKVAIK